MKKRFALLLALVLCLAVFAAVHAEENANPGPYPIPDGATVTFDPVVRVETAAGEDGAEFPVWYIPAEGSLLTYKAGKSAPGFLMFAYESWEAFESGTDMGVYVLFQPNTEGSVTLTLSNESITWPDNACFRFVYLASDGWKTTDLVFRFDTATDGPAEVR